VFTAQSKGTSAGDSSPRNWGCAVHKKWSTFHCTIICDCVDLDTGTSDLCSQQK